jgi:hypothetical protein
VTQQDVLQIRKWVVQNAERASEDDSLKKMKAATKQPNRKDQQLPGMISENQALAGGKTHSVNGCSCRCSMTLKICRIGRGPLSSATVSASAPAETWAFQKKHSGTRTRRRAQAENVKICHGVTIHFLTSVSVISARSAENYLRTISNRIHSCLALRD